MTMNPMHPSARGAKIEPFVRAVRFLLRDLDRAGFDLDVASAALRDEDELRSRVTAELYGSGDKDKDKYDASPTSIDILALPRFAVNHTEPRWRVEHAQDIPPRIYIHFACFPDHLFKHQQMSAALNNLHEMRGVTSRDTVVFVTTQPVVTPRLEINKQALALTNAEAGGKEGQYIIQFVLAELQFDIHAHFLVPSARIVHCRKERTEAIARVAHVLSPSKELGQIYTKDPQMRRLFARPDDVVELLITSETDVERPIYVTVKYPDIAKEL